ncbi:hypothetical protein Tco_0944136, partial [Tanacetum coccineum]
MVVQNQAELGDGLVMPTDPHHTPTIIESSTQPQKTQKPRRPKRKDTQELSDNLVSAATTASSLEAEQDSRNITKTGSKATPNKSSSLGTTSGGGPRVLDLEKTKTIQGNEIDCLKRKVKKLERKDGSRTHKLKRLYKVGLSARVESSSDEDSLGKDASKQGRRINAIDADEDITMVNVQDDAEIFYVNTLTGDEVFAEQEDAAKVMNLTVDEVTLPQALTALKSVKPKVKGVVIQETSTTTTTTTTTTISSQLTSQDKGKGIMVEEPVKTMKKKDLIRLGEEIISKLQDEFDEEERLAREKAKKEANVVLTEEWDDIQAKIGADHELAQRLQAEEQEELSVEEKEKLFQQLLRYLQKKRGTNYQPKLNNEKSCVPTFVDFITYLVEGRSKRVGEELEQERTNKQKLDEDKDTTVLQSRMEVIPDEEEVAFDVVPLGVKFPNMLNKKLQGRIVAIKSLLNVVSITAALIDVNAAQSKLVLLENFNKNYSKCSRLLVKLQLLVQ